jgi:type 1 fimbria pilin
MKSFTTAVNRPTHWKAHSFFVLLVLCLILPSLASAQFVYNIETTTGKNGSDEPIYIVLVGTKGGMDEAFKLDAPGDDFKHGAVNKFTYRSDKDLGEITDISLKAHPQDYWEVKKVTVKKTGSSSTSQWTAFRGNLITGEWTNFFRADGLTNVSENIFCCDEEKVLVSTKIEFLDNLDGEGDDVKRRPVPVDKTVTNKIELVNTNRNSVNNSLNINTSVSYEPFPGGPSFSSEIAYGLEVQNETSKALTQATSSTVNTQDKLIDLVAPPGIIQYCQVKTTEIRKKGRITLLNGETEFYKVIGNEYDIKYYTFKRDNLDKIPEFIIKEKGKPICLTCDEAKKVVANDNPVPKPSPVPQPVDGKATTSQLEVCDAGGSVVGHFKKSGNGWVETDINGNTKFRFSETRSDQGVIYLSDKDRQGVKINLDTNNKEVLYSDPNNTTPFRIYIISKIN